MKRLNLLLAEARQQTENTNYTLETGVQDAEYIRAFNDAQERLMSLILNTYPSLFEKVKEIQAVNGQAIYDNPLDVFLTSRIKKIEFSANGDQRNYYQLGTGTTDERITVQAGNPSWYIRQSRQFIANPAPYSSAAKFRMTYQANMPGLDIRRGKVSVVTLDPTTSTISQLELDPTLLNSETVEYIKNIEYICIVDKSGNIKMHNIPVLGLDLNTGIVSLDSFVYEAGETISVGDYVVAGQYVTTHSQLPDTCERYLLASCVWRILKRDSSNDSIEANQELKEIESEIIASFAHADADVQGVPILDGGYITF